MLQDTLLSAQLKATQDRQLFSDLAEKVRTADGTCPNATRLWIKILTGLLPVQQIC